MSRAGIEAAIGAAGRAGDGAKGVFGFAIVALLENDLVTGQDLVIDGGKNITYQAVV